MHVMMIRMIQPLAALEAKNINLKQKFKKLNTDTHLIKRAASLTN